MSYRLAVVPFDGSSPHNLHVAVSINGVELAAPLREPFQRVAPRDAAHELPAMSPAAARVLADALLRAADLVDLMRDPRR
jgi:hypothetical protein